MTLGGTTCDLEWDDTHCKLGVAATATLGPYGFSKTFDGFITVRRDMQTLTYVTDEAHAIEAVKADARARYLAAKRTAETLGVAT